MSPVNKMSFPWGPEEMFIGTADGVDVYLDDLFITFQGPGKWTSCFVSHIHADEILNMINYPACLPESAIQFARLHVKLRS